MNKDLIRSRFEKHLKDYDKNAKIQKLMAEKLIKFCSRKKYKNILEIGCGTGFLTKEAAKNLDYETYTAIDIVSECEFYIKKIDDKINFAAKDIEKLLTEEAFPSFTPDLIISNASLQWCSDFESVVNKLKNMLSKNGEFIFTTFGKEHFREIFYILGTGLNYYSEAELKEMFEGSEICAQEVHIMSFKTPKDVLKHLKLTGVNGIESRIWTKSDLKSFEDTYHNLCVKIPTLTYNPVYIKFINKTNG